MPGVSVLGTVLAGPHNRPSGLYLEPPPRQWGPHFGESSRSHYTSGARGPLCRLTCALTRRSRRTSLGYHRAQKGWATDLKATVDIRRDGNADTKK
ncbi:hypothetical protein N7527_007175 [Penicillium freii]|nr:hypothetical protein N7527_007175 [Penicillium freii]